MKVFAYFNAYASDYQIKGELSQLGSLPGVNSYELLGKVSGDAPNFCLVLDVADDQASAIEARMKQISANYSGEVSKTSITVYKVV